MLGGHVTKRHKFSSQHCWFISFIVSVILHNIFNFLKNLLPTSGETSLSVIYGEDSDCEQRDLSPCLKALPKVINVSSFALEFTDLSTVDHSVQLSAFHRIENNEKLETKWIIIETMNTLISPLFIHKIIFSLIKRSDEHSKHAKQIYCHKKLIYILINSSWNETYYGMYVNRNFFLNFSRHHYHRSPKAGDSNTAQINVVDCNNTHTPTASQINLFFNRFSEIL